MSLPLTKKQAEERSAMILPGIEYNFEINLKKGTSYSGTCSYDFELNDKFGLFLDFKGKAITSVVVNGNPLKSKEIADNWDHNFFKVPEAHLKKNDKNSLLIKFDNDYYTDGNGIHTNTDSDGKQYLYVQTEPYYANRIYPIFDQPDLKAYMNFKITAPSDWVIVSNTSEVPESELNHHMLTKKIQNVTKKITLPANFYDTKAPSEDEKVHVFKRTPLIASYLFAIVAGPYKSVAYDGFDGKSVPMTIYCRESVFEYAKKQQRDIFLFCKRGIEFYEVFFQTKFQFEKYDFCFCPEFTVGAMEFPGCVTFNDKFIYREEPSSNQVTQRGMVILHELAHFWFGDFVTMKWWNDLWLNESFADFACYTAMSFINSRFDFPTTDGWTMFNARKWKGYSEDSDITTHPIAGEVDSTDVAEGIFDGITYSKGAATLRQLYSLISHEKFSLALKNYFAKYGFKNATLDDFLQEIKNVLDDKTGPYDMDNWRDSWLKTSGHNKLSVKWDSNIQGDQTLTIIQEPVLAQFETLRYHKLKLALFENCSGLNITPAQVIVKNQKETIFTFTNKNYKAILLNFDDYAFARIEIDPTSRDFLLDKIDAFANDQALNQLLIARSFYDSVKDAKLKGTDFTEQLLSKLLPKATKSPVIFENVNTLMGEALNLYSPEKASNDTAEKLFWILIGFAKDNPNDKDLTKNIKPNILKFSRSEKSIELLRQLVEEVPDNLKHVELNLDEKWSVVFKIHGNSAFDKTVRNRIKDLVSSQDISESKKFWLRAIDALVSDAKHATELWDELALVPKTISYTEMGYVLKGLNSSSRDVKKREKFHDQFFETAFKLITDDQKINAQTFLSSGFPNIENFDYLISKTKALNDKLTENQAFFKILLAKEINLWENQKKAFSLFK